MNSLEFINKLIKHTEAQLAKYPLSGKLLDPNYKHKEADIVYKHNKYYTEQLQTLQQIKAELEAWEVVKEEIKIKQQDGYYYIKTRYEKGLINKEQYETIQKALEVKNNG